ncbi:hypothetical protein ES703_79359 [subsurface metagenome]
MITSTNVVRLFALLCVTTLAIVALLAGINDVLTKAAFALIGVIVGTTAPTIKQIIKPKNH